MTWTDHGEPRRISAYTGSRCNSMSEKGGADVCKCCDAILILQLSGDCGGMGVDDIYMLCARHAGWIISSWVVERGRE